MIHTFEFYFEINDKNMNKLFSNFKVPDSLINDSKKLTEFLNKKKQLHFEGIKFTKLIEINQDRYLIFLKADLTKMLNKLYIEEKDYIKVEGRLQEFLDYTFSGNVIFTEEHILTRLDFKYDVKLEDKKSRELLFHLIEKQTKRYRHKDLVRWAKDKNGKPFKFTTSQYHENKSTSLIIYDKEREREESGNKVGFYKGIVRYELRLKNQHLNTKKRQGISKKLSNYFSKEVRKEYYLIHVVPLVRKGDYYTLSKAEKILNNSSLSKTKKGNLRNFLIQIARGNINTPQKNISRATYRSYLKECERLNINPITIPKNMKGYPTYLKNPFQF